MPRRMHWKHFGTSFNQTHPTSQLSDEVIAFGAGHIAYSGLKLDSPGCSAKLGAALEDLIQTRGDSLSRDKMAFQGDV